MVAIAESPSRTTGEAFDVLVDFSTTSLVYFGGFEIQNIRNGSSQDMRLCKCSRTAAARSVLSRSLENYSPRAGVINNARC